MKIISTLLLALLVSDSFAQTTQNKPNPAASERREPPHGEPGREMRERRGPPPEALAACKNKKANTACSFKGRGGEQVKGSCWAPDSSKPLACKPAGRPPNQGEPNQPRPPKQ